MVLGALVRVGPNTRAKLADPILLSLASRETLRQRGERRGGASLGGWSETLPRQHPPVEELEEVGHDVDNLRWEGHDGGL